MFMYWLTNDTGTIEAALNRRIDVRSIYCDLSLRTVIAIARLVIHHSDSPNLIRQERGQRSKIESAQKSRYLAGGIARSKHPHSRT